VEVGKTALVTGGSRGIGRGIAYEFAKAGYNLTIGHWGDEENAESTAAKISTEWGRDCHIVPGDLTEAETAAMMIEAAIKKMGHIDVLVNNAGICKFHGISKQPLEAMDLLMKLNFRAPMLLMKEASSHMIEAGIRAVVLNITSSRAERAYPGDAV
jgi:glucose 1-dehydrogenase